MRERSALPHFGQRTLSPCAGWGTPAGRSGGCDCGIANTLVTDHRTPARTDQFQTFPGQAPERSRAPHAGSPSNRVIVLNRLDHGPLRIPQRRPVAAPTGAGLWVEFDPTRTWPASGQGPVCTLFTKSVRVGWRPLCMAVGALALLFCANGTFPPALVVSGRIALRLCRRAALSGTAGRSITARRGCRTVSGVESPRVPICRGWPPVCAVWHRR